ncbi:hypothetical protein FRD01_14540 [Microvenator marinus]|uniref:Uncharacterized protein n=1 Tax=Microvenator marinus TaxID=2600177 RepID=A0A5B8XRZ4_9DELT|nr:hypothetical protein [Microvenator marinus]QED28430.1 hypothetical protein FRD01_14540 [Microvenator marinus]
MVHILVPERQSPNTIDQINAQTKTVRSIIEENQAKYDDGIARLGDIITSQEYADILTGSDIGCPGYYNHKWETDLMISSTTGRHEEDRDQEVYIAEFLAVCSELLELGTSGTIFDWRTPASDIFHGLISSLKEPWFIDRYPQTLPNFVWVDFTSEDMKAKIPSSLHSSSALAIERANMILINQDVSSWALGHYMIHELAHLLVRAPHTAHGRYFRYCSIWMWGNLDKELGTQMGAKLMAFYQASDLSYSLPPSKVQ